jgi:hypothetical protein
MALARTTRPLSNAETRLLTKRLVSAQKARSRTVFRVAMSGAPITGALCILTLLASSADPRIVVAFWLAVTLFLIAWLSFERHRVTNRSISLLKSALRRNRAEVVSVSSPECLAFEEIDDEGACYAFQVEPTQVLFVVGQDFYESARFPNSDFSLVRIHAESGELVAMPIIFAGSKLRPVHSVPAAQKATLKIPEHLEVIGGTLADIASRLAA